MDGTDDGATALGYRELVAHLEPETEEGARRLSHLLRHGPLEVVDIEQELLTAAASCVDPDVADRCHVATGAAALQRRDAPAAYERFVAVLARRRGKRDKQEARALTNVALLQHQDSRYHEAFVLAGCARRIWTELGDTKGRVVTSLIRANSLDDFGIAEGVRRELDEVDAGLAELGGAPELMRFRVGSLVQRIQLLREEGDVAGALSLLPVLLEMASDTPWYRGLQAEVLLDAGRPEESAELLSSVGGWSPDRRSRAVNWLGLRARVALACGDHDGFRELGRRTLELAEEAIHDLGTHHFGAEALVPGFETVGDSESAERAIEIAAAEHLHRIASLHRVAGELPELQEIDAADLSVLQHAQSVLQERHARTLKRLSEWLEVGVTTGDPDALLLFPEDDDRIRICAWCTRLADRSGTWVHLAHLVLPEGPFQITHGICDGCAATVRANHLHS